MPNPPFPQPGPKPPSNFYTLPNYNAPDGAVPGGIPWNYMFNFLARRSSYVTQNADDIRQIGTILATKAPINNPVFTGDPQAPTPLPGDSDNSIATTAFVTNAIKAIGTGVSSFNGRTGDVILTTNDIILASGAPIASPAFTGVPTAPTAVPGTNTTQIATTAFVGTTLGGYLPITGGTITGNLTVNGTTTLVGASTAPTVATANNSTNIATTAFVKAQNYLTGNQTITISGDASGSGTTAIPLTLATVNSNVGTFNNVTVNGKGLVTAASNIAYLTGNQTITLSGDISGSGTTSITTTLPNVNANVGTFQGITVNAKGQVTAAANQGYLTGNQTITISGDGSGSGTTAIPLTLATVNANVGTFQGITVNAKGQVTAAANQNYAPLASPALTGTPTAPTAAASTNTTQIATTAYVQSQGGQLPATATNDNAAAGKVGEFVTATVLSGSAIALTSNTAANMTSVSLTAGDWDVMGTVLFSASGANVTLIEAALSTASAGLPDVSQRLYNPVSQTAFGSPVPMLRVSIAATTIVYLVVFATFASGCTASGAIYARRAR